MFATYARTCGTRSVNGANCSDWTGKPEKFSF